MSQSKFHSYTNSILDNFALNLTQYGEPKTQKTKLGIRTQVVLICIFSIETIVEETIFTKAIFQFQNTEECERF